MFEGYVSAKKRRPLGKLITGVLSLVVNGGVIAFLVFQSFWTVEKLQSKRLLADLRFSPPPPPSGGAPATPLPSIVRPRSAPTHALHQPEAAQPVAPAPAAPSAESPGTPSDVPGLPFSTGGPNTSLDNLPGDETPPPLPVVVPKVVTSAALDALRVAGDEHPSLPVAVKSRLAAHDEPGATAAVLLCLDTSGTPSSVELKKSTGYPAADDAIVHAVNGWRYRPYQVNGVAVPVCTAVTFVYKLDR